MTHIGKHFVIQVLLDEEIMGEGEGRSKKEAEQGAAKEAYEIIKRAGPLVNKVLEKSLSSWMNENT